MRGFTFYQQQRNARRRAAGGRRGFHLVGIDLDCSLTVEHQGLRLSSVPPADHRHSQVGCRQNGAWRTTRRFASRSRPQLVTEAGAAARLVILLRVGGVDVVTSDLDQPLARSGGVILEVNGTPGLHHHWPVADLAGARVAAPILRELLDGHPLAFSSEADSPSDMSRCGTTRPCGTHTVG